MKFTRDGIIDFIGRGRSYLTWRTDIEPRRAKEIFYSGRKLSEQYPGVDIKYCSPTRLYYPYDVARGDFSTGLMYKSKGETCYVFIGANSVYAPAQSIAIGKSQDGNIYLIYEDCSCYTGYKERFIIVSEEHMLKNPKGFRPKAYYHSVTVLPSKKDKEVVEITDRDITCLKIAYEGVRAFKKLLQDFPVK